MPASAEAEGHAGTGRRDLAAPAEFAVRPRSLNWKFNPLWRLWARWQLSRAKHPGLLGHPRMALRVSRLVPSYEYTPDEIFTVDGAPHDIAVKRRDAFARLASTLHLRSPKTVEASRELVPLVSDLAFVDSHRVPYQFRTLVQQLDVAAVADATDGPRVRDLDGNWAYDLGGSYGVNLFGTDFYKQCIESAVAEARELGMILGPYHPVLV
jgi:glutamate-1-semialdehyde 2,1-aminomutase